MDKLNWCKRQKRGIELVEPNENLCKEYFNKAERALDAVRSLKGNDEWQISSAYYAMYFSLYAILMKVGIKCEIHSCTIEIMKWPLDEYFDKEDFLLMKSSLSSRIDVQYYTDKSVEKSKKDEIVGSAPEFYFKCKEISGKIGSKNIDEIRSKISDSGGKNLHKSYR